jgi:hypothetical protein
LQVTEEFVAAVIGLSMDGERWFKNQCIIGADVSQFLKATYPNEDLSSRFKRKWLREERNEVLKFV